jgi:hypothetical protein
MTPGETNRLKLFGRLIDDQRAEIKHLRAALQEIASEGGHGWQADTAKLTLASHMYSGKWVRQTDDGTIVPGYKP